MAETTDNPKTMVVTAVCGKADCHFSCEHPAIEINFSTSEIYYLCPKCRHMNKLRLKLDPPAPLPRIRGMRR